MWMYVEGERLSRPELMAARLDGDLVEVGEGFIPADAVETSHLRAASLRSLIPATLAVTHGTAAWVHGALLDPPAVHRVQRACAHRIPTVVAARLQYRDSRVPPGDVEVIGGLAVTTPVRTTADLSRDVAAGAADGSRHLEALLTWRPELLPETVAWFRTCPPMHYKRPAQRLLATLLAARAQAGTQAQTQEDVTR